MLADALRQPPPAAVPVLREITSGPRSECACDSAKTASRSSALSLRVACSRAFAPFFAPSKAALARAATVFGSSTSSNVTWRIDSWWAGCLWHGEAGRRNGAELEPDSAAAGGAAAGGPVTGGAVADGTVAAEGARPDGVNRATRCGGVVS